MEGWGGGAHCMAGWERQESVPPPPSTSVFVCVCVCVCVSVYGRQMSRVKMGREALGREDERRPEHPAIEDHAATARRASKRAPSNGINLWVAVTTPTTPVGNMSDGRATSEETGGCQGSRKEAIDARGLWWCSLAQGASGRSQNRAHDTWPRSWYKNTPKRRRKWKSTNGRGDAVCANGLIYTPQLLSAVDENEMRLARSISCGLRGCGIETDGALRTPSTIACHLFMVPTIRSYRSPEPARSMDVDAIRKRILKRSLIKKKTVKRRVVKRGIIKRRTIAQHRHARAGARAHTHTHTHHKRLSNLNSDCLEIAPQAIISKR